MKTLIYDGSFEGLLTSIFEVFEYKYDVVEIINITNYHQENIFSEVHSVATDTQKSDRVLNRIKENL